jgi:hypothetical protein
MSAERLEEPDDHDLDRFRVRTYKCHGGIKNPDPMSEVDSYIPTNVKWLVGMLRPLDKTVKKACYVAPKSRCVKLIARKLVERKEPVLLRFIYRINDFYKMAAEMKPMKWKFEPHLDGEGVNNIMKEDCPERIFWLHLKYIHDHKDLMTSRKE